MKIASEMLKGAGYIVP